MPGFKRTDKTRTVWVVPPRWMFGPDSEAPLYDLTCLSHEFDPLLNLDLHRALVPDYIVARERYNEAIEEALDAWDELPCDLCDDIGMDDGCPDCGWDSAWGPFIPD